MNKWLANASAFAVADFKAFFRDRQAMFWTFFFPIMFMVLLGVVFGNAQIIDFKIGVIDQDGTFDSTALVERIDSLPHMEVVWYNSTDDGNATALAGARAALDKGDLAAYIVIPHGFEVAKANATLDPANATKINVSVYFALDNTGNGLVASQILSQVIGGVNYEVFRLAPVVGADSHDVQVNRGRYIDYLVPGILAMNIMFSGIFNLAVVMTSMRQKGILRRLKVTPVPKSAILAALITTRMIIIFVSMLLILAVGVFLFGVEFRGNFILLVFLVVIGSLSFTTFGFAVSAYAKTVESAESIANVVAMPMMFMGDVFLPVSQMPAFIQPIAGALPLSFLGKSMREVALNGSGIVEIALPVLAVVAYGLIGFVIAIKLFKWE